MLHELQLEGLVGPTHHYAGLSHGNIASEAHAHSVSHPRAAALQSLEKMKHVHALGIPVAVMPPQPRPDFSILQRLGYHGTEREMLDAAWRDAPDLATAIWSASSMWTANAATVTPSCDAHDGKTHLTPANLFSTFHRSIEPRTTHHFLQQIFADKNLFEVHEALPVTTRLSDEGAANHMRLNTPDSTALHIFVYGASPDSPHHPQRYPARQQKAASEAVARTHHIPESQCMFVQQTPRAIDAGVFHNDVIAMSHGNLLVCHEHAFVDQESVVQQWRERGMLVRIITDAELSLADAVSTYFFNAQCLPTGNGITILFPQECADHAGAKKLCDTLITEDNPVSATDFLNLRESMQNGGGPACLRLRVPLSDEALAAVHPGVRFNTRLYQRLGSLIDDHYPEALTGDELRDTARAEALLDVQAKIVALLGLKNPA